LISDYLGKADAEEAGDRTNICVAGFSATRKPAVKRNGKQEVNPEAVQILA